jgi:glycosyltransferase involved in cell wall biosynthesis
VAPRKQTHTRIRVLLIAPSLDILGGQAVQAARLLRELRKEASLEVAFLPMNPRLPGPLAALQKIKYVRTAATVTGFLVKLASCIWRYDILHVFSAAYFSFWWAPTPAILLGKLCGKKVILNYRDGQAEDHLRNWRSAIPVIRKADVIVTPSGFLVDVFAMFGLEARSVFNIIDGDRFRYRERRQLRPVFLTNRILEPLYNVGCILRAFALIQRDYPDASLTIAHDGVCRPTLEQLARQLQLRNTRFIGAVPHEDIPALYDAADLYLTSPDVDCMPGSLLECFASGLPVVATRAGGIPYILTHDETGLLVPCNDHEALAAAALRLLRDPELVARLTANAYREVARYGWPQVRVKWMSIYRELAGGEPRGQGARDPAPQAWALDGSRDPVTRDGRISGPAGRR